MTGRDLILYILQNKLEDENVIRNGVFIGFITEEEAAAKFNVGVATIRVWYVYKLIDGIEIGGRLFFLQNVEDPRKRTDKRE